MACVIFLDIDGVLNSTFWNESHQREISDGSLIDKSKVALLAQLVRQTGAQLILHSGWRTWFTPEGQPLRREAENLLTLLNHAGLTLAGFTPDLTTEEIRRTKKFSLVKAKEILLWLEQHPTFGRWVVLDDLDLHNDTVAHHQVMTNASIGLTQADLLRARTILKI